MKKLFLSSIILLAVLTGCQKDKIEPIIPTVHMEATGTGSYNLNYNDGTQWHHEYVSDHWEKEVPILGASLGLFVIANKDHVIMGIDTLTQEVNPFQSCKLTYDPLTVTIIVIKP